mmetsp:Transcript_19845/g.68387  ORF Transcript_19845/g.68387 Transcript_19845/m.68387 type:complete len:209 (-) Transcript_19845:186-812(-)
MGTPTVPISRERTTPRSLTLIRTSSVPSSTGSRKGSSQECDVPRLTSVECLRPSNVTVMYASGASLPGSMSWRVRPMVPTSMLGRGAAAPSSSSSSSSASADSSPTKYDISMRTRPPGTWPTWPRCASSEYHSSVSMPGESTQLRSSMAAWPRGMSAPDDLWKTLTTMCCTSLLATSRKMARGAFHTGSVVPVALGVCSRSRPHSTTA